jgi:hypothetical protein
MSPYLKAILKRALANPGATATGLTALLCLIFTNLDHDKVLGVAVFILGLLSVGPSDTNSKGEE